MPSEYYAIAVPTYVGIGLLARRRYVELLTRIDPPHFGTVIALWPFLVTIDIAALLSRPLRAIHNRLEGEQP